jgi:hypothetical protein
MTSETELVALFLAQTPDLVAHEIGVEDVRTDVKRILNG